MSQPITITAGTNSHYLLLLGHTPRIVAYYLLLPAAVQHEHGQKEGEHYLLLKHMSCENISIIDISKVKYNMQKKIQQELYFLELILCSRMLRYIICRQRIEANNTS